jgi:NDP-sugar pyrophosphorylase family protein
MQVVILAGGLGTRLGPLTRTAPKPMVPVAGVPYLEHQLRLLARQGLCDVVALTGYLGQQIEEYFGDGRRLGLRMRYSRETPPLGTGGALRHALPLLEESFLVIYGDSYLRIEYRALGRFLEESGAAAAMAVYRDPFGETGVRPNVALGARGAVIRYEKNARDGELDRVALDRGVLDYIEAGVLALRRPVLDLVPPSGAVSLEEQVFPMLIERRQLFGYPTVQRFYDMGTPERLKAIEAYLA